MPNNPFFDGRRADHFFGWWVVGACFVMATTCWGLGFYGNGLYLAYLVQERGWPISLISSSFTFYFWMGAVLVVSTGRVVDRLGPRWSSSLGMLSALLGILLIARVQQIWHLYVGLAFLALGWAWMSGAAINSILARWFETRRGTALSLALTGASMGGILVQPLLTLSIQRWGFTDGLSLVALLLSVLVLSAVALCMVRSPSVLGQGVDGKAAEVAPGLLAKTITSPTASALGHSQGPGILELLRDRAFITNVLPFALGLLAQVGFLMHEITLVTELYSRSAATLAVVTTTASALVGRLVAGYLADQYSRRVIAALNFAVQILGLLILIFFHSHGALYLACALHGLAVGNLIALPGLIIQREFSAEHFAHVNRWATAITQASYALGPAMLGAIREASGSYLPCLVFCASLGLISAMIVYGAGAKNT
jgi:MFS family permease